MADLQGGLAQVNEEDPATGYLGILASQFQTSPEAKERAEEILNRLMSEEAFAAEEGILEQFQETAEQSRQALREARERVLADKFDPRQKWLAMAQAFGAPTQTGSFGETLGNVAGAMRGPLAAQDEFRRSQEEQLLTLDQALAGIDESLLGNEFKLAQMRRGTLTDLGKEALKTLGKVSTRRPYQPPGQKSLDQKMATELVKWQTQGAPDAFKSIAEMDKALSQLGSGRDDISGPLIGLMPKVMRDIVAPEASNVQELIETTAQRSLKAILGGQFGQREGEMLLERTFNPRLEERYNYERGFRLLRMLEEAAKAKNAALAHFNKFGTMAGFEGKTEWTIKDFDPEPLMIKVKMPDGNFFDVEIGTSKQETLRLYEESKTSPEDERAGFAKGGKVRYADGGTVDFDDLEDEFTEFEALGEEGEAGETDVDLLDILLSITGAGVGYGTGRVGTEAVERLQALVGTPAEKKVAGALEVGGVDPAEAMLEVRRGQRMGVPQRPIDTGGRMTRVLGERALMIGGSEAEEVLSQLEERHAGSRSRVSRQIEKSLRTPEFFETEEKLTDRLYSRAKPLYQQAYRENLSVKEPRVLKQIFDSPDGKKAVAIALRIMRNLGKTIGKEDAVGMVRRPSLEFLDNLKKGFDTLIRQTDQRASGPNPLSHSIKDMRSKLMAFLDNPENVTATYGKARAQYKGDLEILQALDLGKTEFLRMPSEMARREIGAMTWAEKNALKTGVAQKLHEVINGPTTDISAARKVIGSPEMLNRLELLFEKPREFRIFKAALEREMDLFEEGKKSLRRVETGRTRRLTEDMLEMDDPLAFIKRKMGRGPIAWAMKFIPSIGGRKKIELGEKEADEIVRILNTGDHKELQELGERLKVIQKRGKIVRSRKGKAALLGAVIGAATAPFLAEEEDE